jgi:hypothetical protein
MSWIFSFWDKSDDDIQETNSSPGPSNTSTLVTCDSAVQKAITLSFVESD